MIPRRAPGAVLAALLGLLVLAGPAPAHTELQSSSPAEGASLATAPTQVQLTFGEPVTLPPDSVKITGRDGTAWRIGAPAVDGGVVTVPVTPSGGAQAYTLTWQVVAKDGDNVTGTVHFTVTGATTLDSVGVPTWIWALVAIAGLLAVIVVGVRQLRSRR
ncbi:copper resistance CopC family protein [Amycolatopsis sp. NPDC004625]|uniref:copper resistance CopC family protein n=1 Tax=Amycolatopsis sp. NPDC004625 TaxID=3154670 RepID=UPI0033BB6155